MDAAKNFQAYVPGESSFHWRAGSSKADERDGQRSELFTTQLRICGLETIKSKTDAAWEQTAYPTKGGTLFVLPQSKIAE